jgi:hypothetical protein
MELKILETGARLKLISKENSMEEREPDALHFDNWKKELEGTSQILEVSLLITDPEAF